jgi:hypothetical protein
MASPGKQSLFVFVSGTNKKFPFFNFQKIVSLGNRSSGAYFTKLFMDVITHCGKLECLSL